MAKKFSLLLAAIAVIAFAVPTFANAASVTQPGGEETSTGTVLTGVSHNTVTETALGELSCEVVSIKALLTHNSGGLVTAEQSGAGSTSGCLLEGEFPVTITNPTLKSLTAEGGATGTRKIVLSFEADLPGSITCHFEGTVSFSYVTGASSFHMGGTLNGGVCGSATISGDYALSDAAGAVKLDN